MENIKHEKNGFIMPNCKVIACMYDEETDLSIITIQSKNTGKLIEVKVQHKEIRVSYLNDSIIELRIR